MSFAKDLAAGLLHLVFPGLCPVCGASVAAGEPLPCRACRTALTHDPHDSCPRCGSTIGPFALLEGGCSACRETALAFEGVVRLGPYDGLLRDVVLRMKRPAGEALAEVMGSIWFEQAGPRLRQVGAQVVVPVPLHWWRKWRRGFNQAEALAEALAKGLGVPWRRSLRRIRRTPPQTEQTPAGRGANVKGAFRARRRLLAGQTVLLVDDVLTTGSTCSEAAKVLRSAGAARVVVAVLAKSQP